MKNNKNAMITFDISDKDLKSISSSTISSEVLSHSRNGGFAIRNHALKLDGGFAIRNHALNVK